MVGDLFIVCMGVYSEIWDENELKEELDKDEDKILTEEKETDDGND